jgi:DNA-binding response OmpR family regulator
MCKVLVVDDDNDILEVLSLILSMNGLQVEAVSKGGEVYDNVFTTKPNVILLDVNLGTHDGRTICNDLKTQSETKDINVIMFSANHNIRQSAMDNKADDFLEKPFDMDQLVERVKSFCN